MGGALILLAIAFSTLLWANLRNRFVWIVLAGTLFFGVIGFVDDYKKLVVRQLAGPYRALPRSSGRSSARSARRFAFYLTAENPDDRARAADSVSSRTSTMPLGPCATSR